MKLTAVICAAGKGERAGFNKNKLLAPLSGAPALWWTLRRFASKKIKPLQEVCLTRLYEDGFDEVLVVCSEEDEEQIKALCAPFGFMTIIGGKTRTESVYNALKAATGDIVVIHDGARPFLSEEIIVDCIACVQEYGSAICATPATDTTACVKGGVIESVPSREDIYTLQTPQGFFLEKLLPAYEKAIKSGEKFTDDSSVYLKYVEPPHIFVGGGFNKKLTYKKDFDVSKLPLLKVEGKKVGFGIDVHAFGKEQNFVTLCGVKVPCDTGLIAHSDGDVAVHAVMDALLSAAGLRDIGYYFPDSDEKYRGADSVKLLKRVMELVKNEGFIPCGLSVHIQAEKPRLSKYINEMVASLSAATGIEKDCIAVAAGTSEGLGFVGEKRGICVYAAAVLG